MKAIAFQRFQPNGMAWVLPISAGLMMASVQAQPVAPVATLPEVVVTATGFEQTLVDAPASISVITAKQLEGKFYRDVTDALQDIPGVSIEGGAGGKLESTSVTIRGMGESYVMFMVDGKPLGASPEAYYNGFGSATQIGWLPPLSAIERIEVIRGPMSSLYGSSALGGVINVITKKVQPTWTGSLTADTVIQQNSDAGNAWQGRYYLSGPLIQDRLGLTVFGSKYSRDEDDFLDGYAAKTRVDNTAKLDWTLNQQHALTLEAGQSRHDNRRTARTGAAGEMNNKRRHYGLTHQADWKPGMQTRTFLTREQVDIENGDYLSSYRSLVLNSKTVLPLGDHMLSLGGEYMKEETRHDAGRFPGSATLDLSRWQTALFIEDEFTVTDAFTLTGGLRYDRNQHYGSHLTPRLYGVYRMHPQWVLKGGVSGGFKIPSLKQADSNIVEIAARGRSWDMGNNDLQPERSTNYELGIAWTSPDKMNAGLTFYHTEFKDKIDKQTICQTGTSGNPASWNCRVPYSSEVRHSINQYINLDRARLQGIEATFGMPILPSARLNAAYTWSDSKITSGKNEGQPLNNTPRHMFNVGIDWDVTERLGVWGKYRFKSRTIQDGTDRKPAYALVDLGVNYQIGKHVKTFVGVYNLFNKEVSSEEYGKTLDGRRYYAGLTVDF